MIELTERAVEAVKTAMAKAAKPVDGMRIQVASGGCAGLQYRLGLEAEPRDDDIVIENDGVKLFVTPKSHDLIDGMVVDFVTRLDRTGFVFENPNAQSGCACGKSFC